MTDEEPEDWRSRALRVEKEVSKAVVCQQPTIRLINVALFARGHVLLEGDAGVGKRTGYWRADEVMQPGDITPGSKVRGAEHLSASREPHLQEIAGQVGFDYARLNSIARAMLDKRFARREKAATDRYWIPALLALLVLAARLSPLSSRTRARPA